MSAGFESARGPGADLVSDFSSVGRKVVSEIQKSRSAPMLSGMVIPHIDTLGAQHSWYVLVNMAPPLRPE